MGDPSRCEGYIQFQHQGKFTAPADVSEGASATLDRLEVSSRHGLIIVGCGDEVVFISVEKLTERFDEKGMTLLDNQGQGGQYEVGRVKLASGVDIRGIGL